MDRTTVEIYEREASTFEANRDPERNRDRARAFGATVDDGLLRADLGCGPGFHVGDLGKPVIALDAARSMVRRTLERNPHALPVVADVEALPLRSGGLAGSWAQRSYVHVPASRIPMALHELRRVTAVGAPVELAVFRGDMELDEWPGADLSGRRFSHLPEQRWFDVAVGAGFDVEGHELDEYGIRLRLRRARSLADTVGPELRVMVCGLNPSLHAADSGIPFLTSNNRFWPAARAAGVTSVDRDPLMALTQDRMGMTDIVKRATPRAAELTTAEYRSGLDRLDRLCAWLRPGVVVVVGLAGWRSAADRRAVAGLQDRTLGGRPVYVMPSTSGLNAATSLDALADHLRRAVSTAA
ncbi:MAG: uracil-DNA glycosylase family protein [Actinomycetota bacterium]